MVIIGGGAAGMLAAIAARRVAELSCMDFSITLLERNSRLGTKIGISGGGKCNVTHQGTPAEMLEQGFLRTNERRFLRNALYGFSSRRRHTRSAGDWSSDVCSSDLRAGL